eukprot:2255467-Karenia_brevis.AAC.1
MKKTVYAFLQKDLAMLQQEEEKYQRTEAEKKARWQQKEAAKEAKKEKESAAGKRPARFCAQCPGNGEALCIFSQKAAGQPASGHNGVCMFCDEERFPNFAQTHNGKREIVKALPIFEQLCPAAHERAVRQ